MKADDLSQWNMEMDGNGWTWMEMASKIVSRTAAMFIMFRPTHKNNMFETTNPKNMSHIWVVWEHQLVFHAEEAGSVVWCGVLVWCAGSK